MPLLARKAAETPINPHLADPIGADADYLEAEQVAPTTLFIRVAVLCSAVAFLDGFDSTSISVAAPLITQQLHLPPSQLGLMFSSALLGAVLGAVSFGRLADRFGRKRMLMLATLIFGVFTLATALAASAGALFVIRFLAGIGLGGAAPCFIALATEFAPPSHRERVTSLIWTAFPVGTVIGTFISAYLVSVSGWQSIFVVGGISPLVVLLALMIWLPESTLFLQLKRSNRAGAVSTARRISIRGFLVRGNAMETLLLWFAFWTVFGAMVAVFSFAPTIMNSHGIPLSRAAIALGLSGIGSLIGSAVAGVLIERNGPTIVLATALLVGALATAALGYAPGSLGVTIAVMAAVGLLVAGIGGAGLLTFAATIYPTAIRSTGIGAAMASARFGQVTMPLAISGMLAAGLDFGHVFIALGVILVIGAVAILLLQRHRGPLQGRPS